MVRCRKSSGATKWIKGAPKSMDQPGTWSASPQKRNAAGTAVIMRYVSSLHAATPPATPGGQATIKKYMLRSSTKKPVAKKSSKTCSTKQKPQGDSAQAADGVEPDDEL